MIAVDSRCHVACSHKSQLGLPRTSQSAELRLQEDRVKDTFVVVALVCLMAIPAHAGRGGRGGGGGGGVENADLSVSISAASGESPYALARSEVVVENLGPKTASDTVLTIELPPTATSPTVHVMGEVAGMDSRCSQSGTTLTYSPGRLRRNRSTTVWFDVGYAHSNAPLSLSATASARQTDPVSSNDTASDEVCGHGRRRHGWVAAGWSGTDGTLRIGGRPGALLRRHRNRACRPNGTENSTRRRTRRSNCRALGSCPSSSENLRKQPWKKPFQSVAQEFTATFRDLPGPRALSLWRTQ